MLDDVPVPLSFIEFFKELILSGITASGSLPSPIMARVALWRYHPLQRGILRFGILEYGRQEWR